MGESVVKSQPVKTIINMISMDNVVEVTPTSPPPDLDPSRDTESPEIRVTDSPEPRTSSEASSSPRRSPTTASPMSSPPVSSSTSSTTRPPLIFQPFLPLPGAVHRSLPFSIDNILKPTFGNNTPAARTFLHNSAFLSFAAASAAAAASNSERQRSPSSSSSSNGSLVKSELKSPPSSPLNNNNQPVDLSSKNVSATSKTSSNGDNKGEGNSEDGVPPGMVRGPNGQLWPAWVFCTRYSDRPSSGPRIRKIKKKDKPSIP